MKTYEKKYKRQKQYVTGIDGLRAIAVLMVFAYHLRLPFARGGLLGVTVFFVISGFLITRILVSELESTGTIDMKKFWIRRIRRLLPAVLAMEAVLIFVSAVFNRVLFTKACEDLLSVIFCYNNWRQIFNQISYFENAGVPSPLTHCWSLAIETQFYMIYPLLLIFIKKYKNWKKAASRVTALLAVVSMGVMWILFDPSKDPSRVYYGTDTRFFSLLFGAFLVFKTTGGRARKVISPVTSRVIGGVAFAGLICMMARVDGYSSFLYRGGQGIASACTVLVIFSLLNGDSILNRLLSIRFLKWIGDRSYGIYLWHYPVIILLSKGQQTSWWVNIVEFLLVIIISDLSYRYIETPIRSGAIGRSIAVIRKRPGTRRERNRQLKTIRRSIRAGALTLAAALGVLLCVAFVPRENTLSNAGDMEKKAEKAQKLANQKAMRLNETIGQDAWQDSRKKLQSNEEILSNLNLLLIGDSIALGAIDQFYAEFPASISDTAVSRQTTAGVGVCNSYVSEKGWNGDGVIFALGANGLLHDSLEKMKGLIGEDKPLFVITVRAPYVNWEGTNNQKIYEFTEDVDNAYLIDWYTISEGHGEFFVEDGTHLSSEGIRAYVEGIKEAVLKVYSEQI